MTIKTQQSQAHEAGGDSNAGDDLSTTRWKSLLDGLLDAAKIGRLSVIIAIGLLICVSYGVFKELETVTWEHVRQALDAIGWTDIAGAAVFGALSYGALIGYDYLALRQIGCRNVSLSNIIFTSFVANALTFSLGFGALTGGAVRVRLYGSAGLAPERVLGVGILCTVTFWMGLAAVTGLSLVVDPQSAHALVGVGVLPLRLLGFGILLAIVGWVAIAVIRPPSLEIQGWTLQLPGFLATLGSLLIASVDMVAAALALWLLFPGDSGVSFAHFLVVFAFSTAVGVVSHVPGGLGVFDGLIVLGLPQAPEATTIASLVLFRLIYYVLPLMLAAAMLSYFEVGRQSATLHRSVNVIAAAGAPLLPAIIATAVFTGGLVLLLSGALPAEAGRLAMLKAVIPLPFVEASHFFGSIAGSLLLVVAHGLVARLRSAWIAALALLSAGACFSLAKGLDFEEALICAAVVLLLLAGRRQFYREGGILSGSVSQIELVAILAATGVSVWLGFAVYRDVDYTNALWWEFAYHGDAPRFLRASLGVAVTMLLVTVGHLLHRASTIKHHASAADRQRAMFVIDTATRADANLARLGDKLFLFSDDGLVMYAVRGSSWIAMGDPVAGSPQHASELIWKFKELVDTHRGRAAFYQVSAEYLPHYLDAGFALVKLGEEAWVDLENFTLEGAEGRKLRQAFAKTQRAGLVLEILSSDQVASSLEELREVSELWLGTRGSKEKGFSLGFWSDDYMLQQDIAVVRLDARIIAFANLWKTKDGNEFTVDLMRHRPDAPHGVMDHLFVGLMLEAKSRGYKWFNLGMAPLSGLPQHRLAPSWSRLGALAYHHAGRFYNFEGLRIYKSKFKPEWRPKYLAYPGGLTLAQVLIDIIAIIAESPKRSASKGDL